MLTSLCLIFLVGLSLGSICEKLKIPKIIGMLITGIVLGPYVLDLFDPKILNISAELRQMALVIILIKAGLSLSLKDLKAVGLPALLLSFVPACFEICGYVIFTPLFFNSGVYSSQAVIEGALIGCVLSAVSPAVVVPRMVKLMDEGYGTDKKIPQMILAGASLDDVFVIVLFTTFLSLAGGHGFDAMKLLDIPSSIILGIVLGAIVGYLSAYFFEFLFKHHNKIRNTLKVIAILGLSFGLLAIEDIAKGHVAISGLLAIMSMCLVIAMKSDSKVTKSLQGKFGKIWFAAEVLLFVLVGAEVDITYTLKAGGFAVLLILIALVFRSLGVIVCTLFAKINWKERLFCVIAYLPKATVQAAIGSKPLDEGLACGPLCLSVAVLGILITAPLGAFGMDLTYKKLLTREPKHHSNSNNEQKDDNKLIEQQPIDNETPIEVVENENKSVEATPIDAIEKENPALEVKN